MSGFYELKCMDRQGFYTYYYFYSPRAIRNPKMALNSGYASDAMRLVVDDREESGFKKIDNLEFVCLIKTTNI